MKKVFLFSILAIFVESSQQSENSFYEELYIKPFPSGHVNTFFQFATQWELADSSDLQHTNYFPRSIAEIFEHFHVSEIHISLTQGLWRYENWGYPIVDAAPGAEIWAWFEGNLSNDEMNKEWENLSATLSGVLCASLNFVDLANSMEPKYSFHPRFGFEQKKNISQSKIRYSSLPREIVCTENLTPWKKLLPCSNRKGFASLLNSGYIHNTNYHSLGIEVRTLRGGPANEIKLMEIRETVNLVYDNKFMGGNDFSIRRMFGQGLNGACSLAKSSKIYVDITDNWYDISPSPSRTFSSMRGDTETIFGEYDIQNEEPNKLFNIAWTPKEQIKQVYIPTPPGLVTHRYILGHGQERGKLYTKIQNNYYEPLNIIVQENIPWYVPCYLHTLILEVNGKQMKPKHIYFVPGLQREKPYHLELALTLPARSTAKIFIDFDYIFLKWVEYPPDANHGFYIGSAIISTEVPTAQNYTAIPIEGFLLSDSFNSTCPRYFLQMRTESLILSLPTPDFSMPYNVICLACTVVALAFGPIHSIATKKLIIFNQKETKPLLKRLKEKIFGKKAQNVASEETEESKKEK